MTAFKEQIVLPWFYGYYGSIWDSSEVDVSYEIDRLIKSAMLTVSKGRWSMTT